MIETKLRDFAGAVGIQRRMKLDRELEQAALRLVWEWRRWITYDERMTLSDGVLDALSDVQDIVEQLYELSEEQHDN